MSMIECPICGRLFAKSAISAHADRCLDETDIEDEDFVSDSSFSLDSKRPRLQREADVTLPFSPRYSSPILRVNSEGTSDGVVPLTDRVSLSSTPVRPSTEARLETNQSLAPNVQSTSVNASISQALKRPTKSTSLLGYFAPSQKSVVQQNKSNLGGDSVCNSSTLPSDVRLVNTPIKPAENVSDTVRCSVSTIKDSMPAAMTVCNNSTPVKQPAAVNHSLPMPTRVPLAEHMRPTTLADFVGQGHIVGSQRPLRTLLESASVSSMILWGPPGCGKTTLAKIIAQKCRESTTLRFVTLSATMAGVADVKDAIKCAKNKQTFGCRTILFIDEIHRFNKLQQDTFLPHVESGTIILIGATTENPSFHINSALLSRCQMIVLEKLSLDNLQVLVDRTLQQLRITKRDCTLQASESLERGQKMLIDTDAVNTLIALSDGDARCALNGLELIVNAKLASDPASKTTHVISNDDVKKALVRSHVVYDRVGEEHYNCISALHKSMRGSDDNAAIYWLARMIEGGEDPLFIARRLIVCASEDIGLADVHALPLAVSTYQACHFIGLPDCATNLAHCVTYLSRARKSNESYAALCNVRSAIKQHHGPQPGVPLHLRNATTQLAHRMGYGVGYQYNHDVDAVDQTYLPDELLGTSYFKASSKSPSS